MSPSIEGLISAEDGAAHRLAMALTPAKRAIARRICAYGRVHH